MLEQSVLVSDRACRPAADVEYIWEHQAGIATALGTET